MKKRLISAILLITFVFCLSACGNQGKDSSTSSKYNKKDLYGQYIDLNSGKTLELTAEEYVHRSADKSRSTSSDWDLDGNTVMISRIEPFEIKAEKNGFKLIAKDNSEYASKGDEYVSYSLYFASLPKSKLGEEAKTDLVKFTLKELEFTELIDSYTYSIKEDDGSGIVPSGDNMVFAYLTFDIENLSKSKIDIVDNVVITLDYDNGYTYSTDGDNSCYYKEIDSVLTRSSGSGGYVLDIDPLSSGGYNVAIPCAAAVKDNSQKSLNIMVTIATDNGVEGFIYKIR